MKNIRQEQGLRLEALYKALGFKNQSRFAVALGVTQSHISNVVNGNKGLSKGLIELISSRHSNVNMNWLVNGEGSMLLPPTTREMAAGVAEAAPEYLSGDKILLSDLSAIIDRLNKENARLREELNELRRRVEHLERNRRKA